MLWGRVLRIVVPELCPGGWLIVLNIFIELAGYAALSVLAILLLANVLITGARLVHNRSFASRIVMLLSPVALLFRLGTPPEGGACRHNA